MLIEVFLREILAGFGMLPFFVARGDQSVLLVRVGGVLLTQFFFWHIV